MEQRNRRPSGIGLGGILIRVALVVACLILLCIHLMGGLFAKYMTNGEGSDSARVAKFQVNVTGAPDAISIQCGENNSGIYTITIENVSEVAVHYDLSFTMTGKTDGVTPVFSQDSGDLAVGASGSSMLTFTVDWAAFTKDKMGNSASETLNFTITVNVVQVD